jgi:GntR family transcriptional regulator, galactonate operon transcriptional repressor
MKNTGIIDSIHRSSNYKLSSRVAAKLALHIVQTLPHEGFSLPAEPELCRQLGVSRTVLREAVKVLEAKGLVGVEQGQGMVARPRSAWNHLDPDVLAWQCEAGVDEHFFGCLCELREIVEPAASELAALRATNAQLATIEECFKRMEADVKDANAYIAADLEFHAAIISACGNFLLEKISRSIGTALRASREISIKLPGGWAESLSLHRLLAEALLRRDGATARAVTTTIVRAAAHDVATVLNVSHL